MLDRESLLKFALAFFGAPYESQYWSVVGTSR
jgi:hypothetical protein